MASLLACLFLFVTAQVLSADAQCSSNVNLTDGSQKSTMSPNYPEHYPKNADCELTITAVSGQVVHVSSVDMHLDGDKNNCNDKIEFMNGDNSIIQTACGMEMVALQSASTVLKIKFTSDGTRESKGYYLKYWSAPAYSLDCSNAMVEVGTTPVFLTLPPENNAQNCEFQLMATNSGNMIYVEIHDWDETEALACGRGSIKVYDGQGTGGQNMVDTCGSERPFWSLGSQGQYLTFKLEFQTNTRSFKIKAMSWPKAQECNMVSSLRVGPVPSFLWYPLFTENNQFCEKTFLSPKTTVRVTVHGRPCKSANVPFTAHDGSSSINEMCNNNKSVFVSRGQDLTLRPVVGSNSPVLLEVTSFESYCNPASTPMEVMASNDTVEKMMIEDIQRNSHCIRRIMAPSSDDVVHIIFNSNLQNACIYVYDGMDGMAREIEKACNKFKVKVGSSQQYLTFKIDSNANTTGNVEARYFSVRKNVACPEEMNMLATRKKKELTTPNYPMEYPLDSMCMWRFVSYRPDYVVVIEVIESDLPEDCSDVAYVNDGETHDDMKLGEWCGIRKPVYRGSGQTLLVTFNADEMSMMGKKGFKFVYYADHKVAREMVAGTDVLTIAGVLTIIVLLCGFIFITYRLCSKKRAKRKAMKEDRQPITQ